MIADLKRLHIYFALLLLALTGCGGKVISPIEGIVKLKSGGSATGATVVFENSGTKEIYSGSIEVDGKFRLTTDTPGDGVPPGQYVVSVLGAPPADSNQAAPPLPFHAKYSNAGTSGLTFEIKPGKNTISLELDPP